MKFVKPLVAFMLTLILSGCTGYRVGSSLDKSIQTVCVKVVNKTDEPSVEVEVMKALRAELQMDGRLKVRSEDVADVILNVTLTSYYLAPLAYNRDRGTQVVEYRLELTGKTELRDAETGEVILENPSIRGWSDFPYAADLTTAKLGALPEASSDLARKVVSGTVTAW
jgi:Lipopolysaccharide-assembly